MDFTTIYFFKRHDKLDSTNISLSVTTNDLITPKHEVDSLGRKGVSPCFKCGKEGHWKKVFPWLK